MSGVEMTVIRQTSLTGGELEVQPGVLLAIQGTGPDHLPLTHQGFIWTGSSDTEIKTPIISILISVLTGSYQ